MRHITKRSAVEEFERALKEASIAETIAYRFAKKFPSTEALNKYLQEHPNADARSHAVARPQDTTDADKSLADLESRAKHNKKQEKKKSEPPPKPASKD